MLPSVGQDFCVFDVQLELHLVYYSFQYVQSICAYSTFLTISLVAFGSYING
jgi:hypothetical protein